MKLKFDIDSIRKNTVELLESKINNPINYNIDIEENNNKKVA